jgi:hypothetical protein
LLFPKVLDQIQAEFDEIFAEFAQIREKLEMMVSQQFLLVLA